MRYPHLTDEQILSVLSECPNFTDDGAIFWLHESTLVHVLTGRYSRQMCKIVMRRMQRLEAENKVLHQDWEMGRSYRLRRSDKKFGE